MKKQPDLLLAVVVKLWDSHERPWIACTMQLEHAGIIDQDEWDEWRRKALDLCLADWREYDIREVEIAVPQEPLDAMFAVEAINAEVRG